MKTKKLILWVVVVVVALVAAFYMLNAYIYQEKQGEEVLDFKNAQYTVEGVNVKLTGNTQYFGNELRTDLDDDGREDIVFLLTQTLGGSGTFYYAVAALNTPNGYVGSEGYLLGDRVAPQSTEESRNPMHKNVVVVNYADRALGEPMTASPSVGKSAYLKLDPASMRWGVVEADFEGEADTSKMFLGMKTWTWVSAQYNDGREVSPRGGKQFTLTFSKDGRFSATTDCNNAGGSFTASGDTISFTQIFSTKMFCENSQESDFISLLSTASGYHFTSKGELILDLKFDSGSAVFK